MIPIFNIHVTKKALQQHAEQQKRAIYRFMHAVAQTPLRVSGGVQIIPLVDRQTMLRELILWVQRSVPEKGLVTWTQLAPLFPIYADIVHHALKPYRSNPRGSQRLFRNTYANLFAILPNITSSTWTDPDYGLVTYNPLGTAMVRNYYNREDLLIDFREWPRYAPNVEEGDQHLFLERYHEEEHQGYVFTVADTRIFYYYNNEIPKEETIALGGFDLPDGKYVLLDLPRETRPVLGKYRPSYNNYFEVNADVSWRYKDLLMYFKDNEEARWAALETVTMLYSPTPPEDASIGVLNPQISPHNARGLIAWDQMEGSHQFVLDYAPPAARFIRNLAVCCIDVNLSVWWRIDGNSEQAEELLGLLQTEGNIDNLPLLFFPELTLYDWADLNRETKNLLKFLQQRGDISIKSMDVEKS